MILPLRSLGQICAKFDLLRRHGGSEPLARMSEKFLAHGFVQFKPTSTRMTDKNESALLEKEADLPLSNPIFPWFGGKPLFDLRYNVLEEGIE